MRFGIYDSIFVPRNRSLTSAGRPLGFRERRLTAVRNPFEGGLDQAMAAGVSGPMDAIVDPFAIAAGIDDTGVSEVSEVA